MTRPPVAKKFVPPKAPTLAYLEPGMAVRMKDQPDREPGVVREHDEWWDSLLIRGVDISEQVLVDWTIEPGPPVVRWERTGQLERILTPPTEDTQPAPS